MKRLMLSIIFMCMAITMQAEGHHAIDHSNKISEISLPIDSITIIYENIEIQFDDLKITVTPSQGIVQWAKNRYAPKIHESRDPQRLCEWQRKEIFDALVNIYITKTIKIVKEKIPTRNAISATPAIMYVTFYSGNHSWKEELTFYYIYKGERYIYSDEFERFDSLIDAIRMAYLQGIPWVC